MADDPKPVLHFSFGQPGELYQLGDVVRIYVNEGDLNMMIMHDYAKAVELPPTPEET